MLEEDLTYKIRGAIFAVYKELGPGLLESIYEAALVYELRKRGLCVEQKIDLLVENKVIVELKSVSELKDVYFKQLLTYLRITNKRVGLLVNFNTNDITQSIKRVVL